MTEKQFDKLYEKAEAGSAKAQFEIGYAYDEGDCVDVDKEEAAYWYEQAAEQGHVTAQYNLGVMYENGEGVDQDDEMAFYWYKKAALQGDEDAEFAVGYAYEMGEGTDEDVDKAIYWYKRAANKGHEEAQEHLDDLLEEYDEDEDDEYDDDEEEEDIEFAELLEKAEAGDADAQFEVACAYEDGNIIEEDKEEASIWYEKAAKQGHIEAQYNLAIMYENGEGVDQDDEYAFYWYEKAAKQGDADAEFAVGWACEYGVGTDEDEDEAIRWYKKAAQQGHEEAQQHLDSLLEGKDDFEFEEEHVEINESKEQAKPAETPTLSQILTAPEKMSWREKRKAKKRETWERHCQWQREVEARKREKLGLTPYPTAEERQKEYELQHHVREMLNIIQYNLRINQVYLKDQGIFDLKSGYGDFELLARPNEFKAVLYYFGYGDTLKRSENERFVSKAGAIDRANTILNCLEKAEEMCRQYGMRGTIHIKFVKRVRDVVRDIIDPITRGGFMYCDYITWINASFNPRSGRFEINPDSFEVCRSLKKV